MLWRAHARWVLFVFPAPRPDAQAGAELYEQESAFRDSADDCVAVAASGGYRDLVPSFPVADQALSGSERFGASCSSSP